MNPKELKEILAKKERVNAVIKDLVDTVTKNDSEKVKSILRKIVPLFEMLLLTLIPKAVQIY